MLNHPTPFSPFPEMTNPNKDFERSLVQSLPIPASTRPLNSRYSNRGDLFTMICNAFGRILHDNNCNTRRFSQGGIEASRVASVKKPPDTWSSRRFSLPTLNAEISGTGSDLTPEETKTLSAILSNWWPIASRSERVICEGYRPSSLNRGNVDISASPSLDCRSSDLSSRFWAPQSRKWISLAEIPQVAVRSKILNPLNSLIR